MNKSRYIFTIGLPVLVAILAVYVAYLVVTTRSVEGSAPSGLPSIVASSSLMAVNTTQSQVLATSTNCAARVISTTGATGGIMITFSDFQSIFPSASYGHHQAASTTVSYDGGIYGCNAIRVYSFATQNITVTETR